MAYNGSVELISGIKQKNNGTFPLVDASAVRVDDSTRLPAALAGKVNTEDGKGLSTNDYTDADKSALDNIKTTDPDLEIAGKAADAKATGDAIGNIVKTEITGPTGWTYYGKGTIGSTGNIATGSTSYQIYYFVASEDFDIWTDDDLFASSLNDRVAYLALYSGSTFSSETYVTDSRVTQHRNSSNTVTEDSMPKANSKKHVTAGQYVVFSCNSLANGFRFLANGDDMAVTELNADISLAPSQIAQVQDAVEIELDDTLKEPDMAAEAKAVGDAIENAVEQIAKTTITGPTGWTLSEQHGYIKQDGSIYTSASGYYIYYFVASEDFDIWTDDDLFFSASNSGRIYMGLYSGSTFSSETFEGGRGYQYRDSSNTVTNDTMPKANSKTHVTAGQYVVVCTYTEGIGFRFLANGDDMAVMELNADISLAQSQIEQVQEAEVRPIVNKTSTMVNMYIPTANKKYFLHYTLTKVDNPTINAYGWRLANTYLRNLNKSTVKWIVTNTEWEMAIKMNGRDDFIGMGSHGDEIQDLFRLYIDGEAIGENDEFSDRPWNVIQLICGMTMYDPADSTVVVGYHTRVDTINAAKRTITIENKVEFADTLPPERNNSGTIIDEHPTQVTMKKSYLFMCPIMRTYGEKQITDTFIDNEDYVLTDCSTTTFDPSDANKGVGANKHLSTEYKFWGADYDLHGYARILRRVAPESVTQTNTISKSESYNKIYYSVCAEGEKISGGDVWLMETEFFLDSGYDGDPVDASASE